MSTYSDTREFTFRGRRYKIFRREARSTAPFYLRVKPLGQPRKLISLRDHREKRAINTAKERLATLFDSPAPPAAAKCPSISDVCVALRRAREQDGASTAYLRDLAARLKRFEGDFGEVAINQISHLVINDWLRNLTVVRKGRRGEKVSPTTRNNFRRVLGVLFSHAVKEGHLVSNPVSQTEQAKTVESEIGVLAPSEMVALLEAADPRLVPYLVIGGFAGLRRSEIERLDWYAVNFEEGVIDVSASRSKSARRRLVRITKNLDAWLGEFADHCGPVAPSHDEISKLLKRAQRLAGIIKWPSNALRHSFATYHLARFQDAGELALEMGHTSTALIFRHYRAVRLRTGEAITKPLSKEWWAIKPAQP